MTKFRKAWPYLLILLVLLGGGGWYLHLSKANVPIISKTIDAITDQKDDQPETETAINFKNYGPAPEFTGITKWDNTANNSPLTIAGQKGKVTLVEFWTYSSINSMRTIPNLVQWQKDYLDSGLQVIGVHTPQYSFEKITANMENAMKTHSISFPVAQDNDYKTWTAYHNQFWPAIYLIDRGGNIVYTHYGEGNYEEIEKAMRTLLGLEGNYSTPPLEQGSQAHTPEIYFGIAKQNNFGNSEKPTSNEQIYVLPKKLADNKFAIEGQWTFNQEAAIHTNGYGRIKLNFDAAKVSLVAQAEKPTTIRIFVDGELVKGVVVQENQLYELYNSIAGGKHTMEIEIPYGGFQAFTFTFG